MHISCTFIATDNVFETCCYFKILLRLYFLEINLYLYCICVILTSYWGDIAFFTFPTNWVSLLSIIAPLEQEIFSWTQTAASHHYLYSLKMWRFLDKIMPCIHLITGRHLMRWAHRPFFWNLSILAWGVLRLPDMAAIWGNFSPECEVGLVVNPTHWCEFIRWQWSEYIDGEVKLDGVGWGGELWKLLRHGIYCIRIVQYGHYILGRLLKPGR